ncbi:Ribosomal protein l34e superfamily protein [Thalictrum thalictroides]|uniref:Ribosomal protein l34e superfamily protein n=1 Tax=Thalictrum thalictroides TaxID=46969 RepID=A0A7J6WHG5_THATH|nr:Ribosomal protein l34e superfamily protein [Thalictrum thalictroides]
MVYFGDSIEVCKSTNMANSWNLTDQLLNSKQNQQIQRNRKQLNLSKQSNPSKPLKVPFCEQSRTGPIDVIYLIAVISACGYLIFPYIKLFFEGIIQICVVTFSVVKDEVYRAPLVYISIGFSLFFAIMAAVVVFKCMDNKCGNPNCLGLRKAAEFDIQLETEDCVKNSSSLVKDGSGRGLFKLSQGHHRELEAELKKMAPPNGRAVLVFRASCGCPVGKMEVPGEVPGPKKPRKIKK